MIAHPPEAGTTPDAHVDEAIADRPSPPAQAGGGGKPPAPPRGRGDGWWRSWPAPPNRPRPINGGNLRRGAMVVTPLLAIVDGALGVMAWRASGRWAVGLAVGGVLFLFTAAEFAIVVWAAGRRQEQERRRSRG